MMPRVSLSGSSRKSGSSGEEQDAANTSDAAQETPSLDLSANEASPSAPPPPPPPPAAKDPFSAVVPPVFEAVDGKPKAGFTTVGTSCQLIEGDGTCFDLRIGPDYKKHGKKAPSQQQTYQPMTMDVFKRKKVLYHVASKLTLPPPPDGAATANPTGLPRRIIINIIVPADGPSLLGGGSDGACYQIVTTFATSAATLAQWQASGEPAFKLFERFIKNAPEGVLPSSGDVDIKERLKLLPHLDNWSALNLPGWLQGYNGKPALLTKSGVLFRGDDYLEISINTFRFGFLTKKGMHTLLPRLGEFDLHASLTVEGRDDAELPERTLLGVRVRGCDLFGIASEVDLEDASS